MFDRLRARWRRPGPPPATPAGATAERRRADRTPLDATIVCRAGRAGLPATEVRVRDVSVTGLSFRIDRPLPPGVMMTLELPAAGGVATVLACARHCTRDPDGGWVVGCSFAAELGEGDLAGFGVQPTEAPAGDQRRWARTAPARGRAVVRRLADCPTAPVAAKILNLSPAGIGLVFDTRVEPGTLLDLELIAGDDHPGLTILASVVYVGPHPDRGWVLGCTFVRDLSPADFRLLG
jgi:hypothetical protein